MTVSDKANLLHEITGGTPGDLMPPPVWEKPIPFDTVKTIPFPVESLPSTLAAFVETLSETNQTPEEMAAVLSLGVLSAAFQGRYDVEGTADYREPLCLYPVAIAEPGERKSAVISALTEPVREYEAEKREAEAGDIMRNQTERAMLEKALVAAQSNATKKKGNYTACRDEALSLSEQLAVFKDKHPFRLLADDTTPEKLVDLMDKQGGCIAVTSAEGGLFDTLAGRYNKGANIDVYLKGHSGDTLTVDRISRKSNHIPKPRLTMLLTIQPEVLHGLMGNATFRGRGLCARFLYVLCKSNVGRRNVNPPTIPPTIKEDYRQFVRRILSGKDKGIIRLSAEAQRYRLEYAAYVEKRLAGDLDHMRDWAGKLTGAQLRIAALIHAAELEGAPGETRSAAEVPVSIDTMGAAGKIAECLCSHAMAAYQAMGADEGAEDARYLLRRLSECGCSEIKKRDLWRMCHGKYSKAESMDAGLNVLVDCGYIRMEDRQTKGRPSTIVCINPAVLSVKSAKR